MANVSLTPDFSQVDNDPQTNVNRFNGLPVVTTSSHPYYKPLKRFGQHLFINPPALKRGVNETLRKVINILFFQFYF